MALLAKAGTFTAPGAGVREVTGLGFRPKAIFFWTENATSDNVWSAHLDVSYGLWVRVSPAQAARASSIWISSDDAAATMAVAAGFNTARPIQNQGWRISSITERGDNDGFTVTAGSDPPAQTRVHYLAFNADVRANLLAITIPAGGVVGQRVQVRGAGFTPSSLIALTQRLSTAAEKTIGIGFADGSANQFAMSGSSLNAAAEANTSRGYYEDSIVGLALPSEVADFRAKVVGYVEDGFDLEYITPPTAAVTVYFLALADVMTRVTVQAKPIGAAPAAQAIAAGFGPEAAIFGGTYQTVVGQAAHHRGFVGAVGGAVQAAGAWSDADALTISNSSGLSRQDATLLKSDVEPPALQAIATAALTATGVTATWTTNDAIASRFGAFFVGNLKHKLGLQAPSATELRTSRFVKPILLFSEGFASETIFQAAIRQIAILGATFASQTQITGSLRLSHTLGGTFLSATAFASRVALSHTLGSSFASDTDFDSRIWIPIILGTTFSSETDLLGRIALSHTLGTAFASETDLDVYFTLILPALRSALASEIPGTINIHINPGAEGGLAGWLATGGATVHEEVTTVWEGVRAVRVAMPGVSAGEGLVTESAYGTDWTGTDRMMWGSVYASSPAAIPVTTVLRAYYKDGTIADGEPETFVLAPTPNWTRVIAPPLSLDPAKVLARVVQITISQTATAGDWFADGAQIEQSQGADPTPWVSGDYGLSTGEWVGAPNRSPSIRLPISMQTEAVGHGGLVEIECRMFRMTWDNIQIEDITEAIIQGATSADPSRDVTWEMGCTMTIDGYRELKPRLDWVAPFVTRRYADGEEETGQLGLYLVIPSEAEYEEHRGTVRLSAYDPLWLLSKQKLSGNLIALPNTPKSRIARNIIDGAVLTGGQEERPGSRRRYFIPEVEKGFKKKREWPSEENRLQLTNAIIRSASMYSMWSDGTGFMLTRKRGADRLKRRQPVATWVASVPADYVPEVDIPDLARLRHEVIGRIPTTPKALDMVDEILLVNDDPHRPRIHVRGKVRGENGNHPRTIDQKKGRRLVRKLHIPFLDDEATAEELAASLADDLSARTQHITLSVIPRPGLELLRETVATAIWDLAGNPIAVGHWVVRRISFSLWPSTPIMTMELSRIPHGADDVRIEVE